MSSEPIGGHDKPDETPLKLYAMLLDQFKMHTTIFWQFPIALVAADVFAVDKFLKDHPRLLISVFVINLVFVYALQCMWFYQKAIIDAMKLAESHLRKTNKDFIPEFGARRHAFKVMLGTLWLLTFGLLLLSLCGLAMQ